MAGTVTSDEIAARIGRKVYEDDNFVVRIRQWSGGLRIKVHHKSGPEEVMPKGYVIGSNMMIIETRSNP